MAKAVVDRTLASEEWLSLTTVYRHVLANSPSPEAAKIAITTARKNGQLRMRCTLRELKAQPGLRLAPGEKPPPAPTVVTQDHLIPANTAFKGCDWERGRAHRYSPTKSLYEYIDITVHRDDVLALWPGQPAPATRAGADAAKKPDGVTARVWAVAQLMKQWESDHGSRIGVPFSRLLSDIQKLAKTRGISCGDRTLREALRYLEDPAGYSQRQQAKKRKTRRRSHR
jgi:hypothetical protein